MKFTCLAAALLSSLLLFANAQSNVQVYGVMARTFLRHVGQS